MKLLLISFKTTDNLILPGLLYKPVTKTNKVAIYLHGNGSASVFYDTSKMNILGETLTKKGIAFFPFNNRGAHYIKSLHRIVNEVDHRVLYGTSYELIKDCVCDIEGAIEYLRKLRYQEFYLIGESTGANKICVYHYFKPQNPVRKYILLSGGDDTGLYYKEFGKEKFEKLLNLAAQQVEHGKFWRLIPGHMINDHIYSHQSWYDTLNPDGNYNIFPFNEALNNLHLSKKELFREFKSIDKPTLVMYGENDEYCYGDVGRCVEILKKAVRGKKNFSFEIIPGADHGFGGKEKELTERIIHFIEV